MKTMWKALICSMLAVAMMLSMVACNGGNNAVTDENDTAVKEKSEEVVRGFLDAVIRMEYDKASEYVVDELDEKLGIESKDYVIEETIKIIGLPAAFEKDVRKVAEKIVDTSIGCKSYTIEGFEKKDGKLVYTIKFKTKNSDAIHEKFYKERTIAKEELTKKLIESGKITEEMSQEQVLEIVVPELIEILEDIYMEAIDAADEVERKIEFVVSIEDGKWLISDWKVVYDFGV